MRAGHRHTERCDMNQVLRCADTGLYCDFVICGQTREQVLYKAGDHVREFHKTEFSKDLYQRAWNAIHEGDCEKEIQTGRIVLF